MTPWKENAFARANGTLWGPSWPLISTTVRTSTKHATTRDIYRGLLPFTSLINNYVTFLHWGNSELGRAMAQAISDRPPTAEARVRADPSGRAVYGVGLRPPAYWDCGFESHRGHGCLYCVCCKDGSMERKWHEGQKDLIQYKNGSKGKNPGQKKKSRRGHGCLCCVYFIRTSMGHKWHEEGRKDLKVQNGSKEKIKNPGWVHVEFLVDKVALGQVFPRVLRFSPVIFIPPVLHYTEKRKKLSSSSQGCTISLKVSVGP